MKQPPYKFEMPVSYSKHHSNQKGEDKNGRVQRKKTYNVETNC